MSKKGALVDMVDVRELSFISSGEASISGGQDFFGWSKGMGAIFLWSPRRGQDFL